MHNNCPEYAHFERQTTWHERQERPYLPLGQTICDRCWTFWPCVAYVQDANAAAAELRAYFRDASYGHAGTLAAA